VLPEVTSTLDAASRLTADTALPFWLLAHQQTDARGRRGRAWAMPPGNFAATLVLPASEPPDRLALRSFAMSLALLRSCAALTGDAAALALKWPNDVLLNGGKLAGILLETTGGGSQALAIGVGVNLANAPSPESVEPQALPPVSLLGETGVSIAPEAFLDVLATHYAEVEQQFQTYGFAPIRTAWLAHAARLGEPLTARTVKDSFTGTFEDVDAEGHLVLRGPRGVEVIAAADVYF
jgi:BirA family biotin operon repressor/biotin-[acetyl-CoA-carboxylase] ligase